MRKSDVVGSEVPSVHLESGIVVGGRLPIGMRRSRLEVSTTSGAVALGHLATHVDNLAISGKLPEDSANLPGLEFLKWSLSIHKGQTRARTGQNLLLASMATVVQRDEAKGEETRSVAAANAAAECAGKSPATQRDASNSL
jgi:hypothetical protein